MAGHNKWSKIKRKKGVADARRSKVWARITRDIMVAAREGGGNPDMNARLALAVDKAKAENMPKDNIERAIKRGTGEIAGADYEEVAYEGYAPGGIAVFVEALTDNTNRTVADLRSLFTKAGGNLGTAGSVAFLFDQKAVFEIPAEGRTEDDLVLLAAEAGAEDLRREDDAFVVQAPVEAFGAVPAALQGAGIEPASAPTRPPASSASSTPSTSTPTSRPSTPRWNWTRKPSHHPAALHPSHDRPRHRPRHAAHRLRRRRPRRPGGDGAGLRRDRPRGRPRPRAAPGDDLRADRRRHRRAPPGRVRRRDAGLRADPAVHAHAWAGAGGRDAGGRPPPAPGDAVHPQGDQEGRRRQRQRGEGAGVVHAPRPARPDREPRPRRLGRPRRRALPPPPRRARAGGDVQGLEGLRRRQPRARPVAARGGLTRRRVRAPRRARGR